MRSMKGGRGVFTARLAFKAADSPSCPLAMILWVWRCTVKFQYSVCIVTWWFLASGIFR